MTDSRTFQSSVNVNQLPNSKDDETLEGMANILNGELQIENGLTLTKGKGISEVKNGEKTEENNGREEKKSKKRGKADAISERKADQVIQYLNEFGQHLGAGSPWKFKKQHQNWIVKHLYNFPWKNETLLIRYLETVQGQTRGRLLDEASKILNETGSVYPENIKDRAKNVSQALNK